MFTKILTLATIAVVIGCATQSPAVAQSNVSAQIPIAPIWKTISLGTYSSAGELYNALDRSAIHIGVTAEEALHRSGVAMSGQRTEVQLAILSVAELGFAKEASLDAIYARARNLGFELCAVEVAAQLRLQYLDQRVGESTNIAMEPIETYEGEPISLTLANGGAGLMLVGAPASQETRVNPVTRYVFVRPLLVAARAQ